MDKQSCNKCKFETDYSNENCRGCSAILVKLENARKDRTPLIVGFVILLDDECVSSLDVNHLMKGLDYERARTQHVWFSRRY